MKKTEKERLLALNHKYVQKMTEGGLSKEERKKYNEVLRKLQNL